MRIAFLGTPAFAVPSLKRLLHDGHTLAVFTQPDRPQGRHAQLMPPPVKAFALANGIPVYQPARIKSKEGVDELLAFAPELMVTAAFGQILSVENLVIPKYGCINVHGSLLPKYRGAAPIQWAVINGEKITGITTMQTDVGLDTGDILLQRELEIGKNETAGELYLRMAELGADTLHETLARLMTGTLIRTPQDEAHATHCKMLKKEDGRLDFSWTAQRVHDRVRGVNPWPGAFARYDGAPLKIWRTHISEAEPPVFMRPGLCFGSSKRGLFVCCRDKAVEVLELQAPGGKRMDAKMFLRGKQLDGVVLE